MVTMHLLRLLHVTSIGQLLSSLVSSFGRSLSRQIARADKFILFCYIQSFVFSLVSQVFILVFSLFVGLIAPTELGSINAQGQGLMVRCLLVDFPS